MEKKTDLRVIRTRKMIKDAFLELLATVGFSKISVDMLAKKAFISRNTFYLHYTDKFDLMSRLEDEILANVKEIADKEAFSAENVTPLLKILHYIKSEERFFKLVLSDGASPTFMGKLYATMRGVITQQAGVGKFKIKEHYALSVITSVQSGVIGEWLRSGMAETPEELFALSAPIVRELAKALVDWGERDSYLPTDFG